MKISKNKLRVVYGSVFFACAVLVVAIAGFVRDSFIRPYGGDVLVTIVLCAALRILFPLGVRLLPFYVFLFSATVELGQYFKLVELLGLDSYEFFRIWMGATFSPEDILCYGAGCACFFLFDYALKKKLQVR